jgi:hypothetical protein
MSYPTASKPSPSQLQLVVHAGPLAGKGFPITGNILTFGRDSDNDIVLDDTQVSRNHARLIRQGDEVIMEDLGSTNGTLVNGKPIVGQHVLQPADIISIGSSVFGVKGFVAPSTIGVTQISMEKRSYPPPVPQAPPSPPRIPSPSPPSRRPAPVAPKAEPSRLNMLVVGGLIALILVVVIIAAVTAYFLTQERGSGVAGIPTVVITAPTTNSQVPINVPVTVQATASDPAGVKRMELWVSNIKTADAVSPVEQGQPTLTASFQWTPPAPGTYTLEVKAFNSEGRVSAPTTVTVNAVGESAAQTPTPTSTPETPTPTVPATPSLTTKTDLNVRSGPGTQYDLLGLLPTGVTVEIIGRDETRQWWQVRFSPAADGIGWVAADPAFSTTANVDNVPVAQAPPTPTGTPTPTDTPVPPTSTPTSVPASPTPTDTPTLTPTPTGQPTVIEFNVSPTSIEGGNCVNITWYVSGVREVYFEDQGVGGQANITDCPKESKTYDFRVIRLDGSEYREEIRVEVNNPIVSAGSVEIPANNSIDLDKGRVSGDDFSWEVDGGTRLFKAREGVQLAPMRDLSNLKNLSRGDCENAAFGVYNVIDGSDDASDPANSLIKGRSACYRTNEGRLGKLWFPDGVSKNLDIEWVTWR